MKRPVLEIGPALGAGVWAYFVRSSKTTRVSYCSKANAAPVAKPERLCGGRRGISTQPRAGTFSLVRICAATSLGS
jgi:hypothetical protein